jgi:hypothetical protein
MRKVPAYLLPSFFKILFLLAKSSEQVSFMEIISSMKKIVSSIDSKFERMRIGVTRG